MDDVRAPQSPVDRIAGAPISWGVCEVPDWGYQLAPSRVPAEMSEVGLAATELGPEGFLPPDPDAMAAVLAAHGLTAVGDFTPVVHERVHGWPTSTAFPRSPQTTASGRCCTPTSAP